MIQKNQKIVVLLLRHAFSKFNELQAEWRKTNNVKPNEEDTESVEIKQMIDDDILDTILADGGIKQCEEARIKLEKYPNIKYIVTSPFRRCVETVEHSFKHYKPVQPIKYVALKNFREKLFSACDIPNKTLQLQKLYPHIDFSFVQSYPEPSLWYLYELQNVEQKEFFKECLNVKAENIEAKEKIIHEKIAQKIGEVYPKSVETNEDFRKRIVQARKDIVEFINKVEKEEGVEIKDCELVISSHSRALQFFTATQFDTVTGKPLDGKWIQNADIIEYVLDLSQQKNFLIFSNIT